jgi:hypothetical protein
MLINFVGVCEFSLQKSLCFHTNLAKVPQTKKSIKYPKEISAPAQSIQPSERLDENRLLFTPPHLE